MDNFFSEEPHYQELNMSNYNEEDVATLNEWGIWAVGEIETLRDQLGRTLRRIDNPHDPGRDSFRKGDPGHPDNKMGM